MNFNPKLIGLISFLFKTTGWQVDHKVPGGTDKDGWQYAHDFHRSDNFTHIRRSILLSL